MWKSLWKTDNDGDAYAVFVVGASHPSLADLSASVLFSGYYA
jgi:hypothetical protein